MRYYLLLSFVLIRVLGAAQMEAAALDSMKQLLAASKTPAEKVSWLDNLSRTLMNVDLKEADKYGNELIIVAEESRDRQLMIDAYKSNGLRCSYFGGEKDYTARSISFYNKALEIAGKEKVEKELGGIQLSLALVYLQVPDKDKALSLVNQAFSVISTLANDSLKVESHNTFGRVYLSRNEKTLSLRNFFAALRITEELKEETKEQKRIKATLARNCYLYLSNFYSTIKDYDKAIDYYTKAFKKLDEITSRNTPYQKVIDINRLGNLFAEKENSEIAIKYYEQSIQMADSLNFSSLKFPGYISLLNQYLKLEQPQKALSYMSSEQGESLKKYLNKFGFSSVIDEVYGVIYLELGKFDSASVYLLKALPHFEKNPNNISSLEFYKYLAEFYQLTGQNEKAIKCNLKIIEISQRLGKLKSVQDAAGQLDTIYSKMENYKIANSYNGMYYLYKDSIEKLNKENELTQIEAADEQQRQERLTREKLEKTRQRNNIQYLGITLGIAALFIVLVILGMFKVSATTIKMIGFFTFLMFFEFIFLIFKKNIYALTHGEPWKDLLFMIGLAALLLPLHHWMEKKVIEYLTTHNRLTAAGQHLKTKIFKKPKQDSNS